MVTIPKLQDEQEKDDQRMQTIPKLLEPEILAVKKLDKRVSYHQTDDEFLELVNSIDRIRHANIVELIGYCAEHGQRLLIYEYCNNGSLQDALHSDDEFKTNLK
ncbi:hypothetical protein RJT34_09047 [Clitoria ternatea]|uniref:Protein kinase domain-containing protein n=1 Tax=Clitoria ternatea TaxID=43366 RepID=A0AAN9K8G2_CLITE